jgi:hypothetical protein
MYQYTRFGYVNGLGDEEIPVWLAPYVHNFVALAKSTVVLENLKALPNPAVFALTRKIAETAAIARISGMEAGVSAALAEEIDEFCGTPPRRHHLDQAALVASLVASGLEANDAAKAVLVEQVERLQRLQTQAVATAA